MVTEEVKILKTLGERHKLLRRIRDNDLYHHRIVLLLKPNLSFHAQWKLMGLGFRKGKVRQWNKGKYIRFYKKLGR